VGEDEAEEGEGGREAGREGGTGLVVFVDFPSPLRGSCRGEEEREEGQEEVEEEVVVEEVGGGGRGEKAISIACDVR